LISAEQLEQFPVKAGFRLRGMEMTRLETFVDASFAFALTLLVVSMAAPQSYDDIIMAMWRVPAFLPSFVLLMMFWHAHDSWSRRFGLDDLPTTLISFALVFTMLVYVFPLRLLFESLVVWAGLMTGIEVPTDLQPFESGAELHNLFIIYSLGFALTNLWLVLLNLHALAQRKKLCLNAFELFSTKAEAGAWAIVGGVGLLSAALAAVTDPGPAMWPGSIYWLLAFVMPAYGVWVGRMAKRLQPGS
jgi:uncharacterized membrane protein